MARVVGVDFNRGLAILGMIFVHSFQGGLAEWNSTILYNFMNQLNIVLVICILGPVFIFGQLGSLFTFFTGLTTSMSVISLMRKKKMNVCLYIFNRLLFGVILKFSERIYWTLDENSDIFKDRKIVFFTIWLTDWAHTIDSIAWAGVIIPIIVAILMKIPVVNKQWKIHIIVLYIIMIAWWVLTPLINTGCEYAYNYFHDNQLYMIGNLFHKMYNGPFMISLYLPFGFFGCIWGILMSNCSSWKAYWWFGSINFVVLLLTGCLWLFFTVPTSQLFEQIMSNNKPIGYLILNMAIENMMHLVHSYFTDGSRTPEKLLKSRKHTTYARRMSCISLTGYIFQPIITKYLRRIFELFCGPANDTTSNQLLWSLFPILLFMCVNVAFWIIIAYFWEKTNFRFSLENQVSCVMKWLLNVPTTRNNYYSIIHGCVDEIQKVIDEKKSDIELNPVTPSNGTIVAFNTNANDILTTPSDSLYQSMQNSQHQDGTEEETIVFEPQIIVDDKQFNQK